jgi:amphi-Trp domain-containing protein
MSDKESLGFKNTVSPLEAADFLESLAKSLREGSSLLESGDQSIGLRFGEEVRLDLAVESDTAKGKGTLELALKWRAEPAEASQPTLVIVPGALVPANGSSE